MCVNYVCMKMPYLTAHGVKCGCHSFPHDVGGTVIKQSVSNYVLFNRHRYKLEFLLYY